jgi:hypothetical protein
MIEPAPEVGFLYYLSVMMTRRLLNGESYFAGHCRQDRGWADSLTDCSAPAITRHSPSGKTSTTRNEEGFCAELVGKLISMSAHQSS